LLHMDRGDVHSIEADVVAVCSVAWCVAERPCDRERMDVDMPESAARSKVANLGDVVELVRPWLKRTRLEKANPVVTWSTEGGGMHAHASASGD
jgi:hypothetical protein